MPEQKKCELCHALSDHVEKRRFTPMYTNSEGVKIPVPVGVITSQKELCDECATNTEKMLT